jgi:hypothetical protein
VTLTASDYCLLELARTDAERYTLELTFVQHPWASGVGAYFGDHGDGSRTDRIDCRVVSVGNAGASWQARYDRLTEIVRGGFARSGQPGTVFPPPAPGEHTLRVDVSPAGPLAAYWDEASVLGRPMPDDDRARRVKYPAQGLGVIITHGSVVLKRAKFLIPE